MKMLPLARIAVSLLLLCTGYTHMMADSRLPRSVDDALDLLRVTLGQQNRYLEQRELRIDSLKRVASSQDDRPKALTMKEIAREYSHIQIDSALRYFEKSAELSVGASDTTNHLECMLRYAALLPIITASHEAREIYDSLDPDVIPPGLKGLYYKCGNKLYFFLSTTYSMPGLRNVFLEKGRESTSNYLQYVTDSVEADYYQAELDFLNRNDVNLLALSIKLEQVPLTHPFFARSASLLGDYYNMIVGDTEKGLYYKALAATSDIMTGNREEMALQSVGMALYRRGDIALAYECLMAALDHAVASGAKVHLANVAESLPTIAASFRKLDQRKVNALTWLVIALGLALVVIVTIFFMLRRKMRAEVRMRSLLREANVQKESFISQFLNLCSIYMESLEEFSRVASRKIKAGQVEDLYNMIKSGKMLDEQNTLFCDIFDRAFTRIYPTFVEGVNQLLMPEKQIRLSDGELLNTELRILAFMRLGTDDSSQIARFLQLSLNTIYTYRNKLKNKAVNRHSFEADVMKIERIE